MANSYQNKLEILQFFLDESKIVLVRKKPWFCLNSFNFEKGKNQSSVNPGRKKFRTHLNKLLEEKLIIRVITNDKRSKFFSITPYGICYLINSLEFNDIPRIKNPNRTTIYKILETFASRYVKPYKSHVINNNQKDFENFYQRVITIDDEEGLGEYMPDIFSSFKNSRYVGKQFFIPLSVHSEIDVPIARFYFRDLNPMWDEKGIEVSELGHTVGKKRKSYSTILDDEQFHHYLASLLLYFTLYFQAKIDFDVNFEWRKNAKNKTITKELLDKLIVKKYPEEFLQILLSFNNQILNILCEQTDLVKGLHESMNKIQFNK